MSRLRPYSKFLSYVLRHRPDTLGLELEPGGWVEVEALLEAARQEDPVWTLELLREVVETNDKQRFELRDGKIRARQGHSVEVDLGYAPLEPPTTLYHGTVEAALEAIRAHGLQKMSRHHVHLSPDEATATTVGRRRGRPIILTIAAGRMHEAGYAFYRTDNGVWLVDEVPPRFIDFPA